MPVGTGDGYAYFLRFNYFRFYQYVKEFLILTWKLGNKLLRKWQYEMLKL
jgi:hypothetical protein